MLKYLDPYAMIEQYINFNHYGLKEFVISVPGMRIWSILLIKSDLNGVYILLEVSYFICPSILI